MSIFNFIYLVGSSGHVHGAWLSSPTVLCTSLVYYDFIIILPELNPCHCYKGKGKLILLSYYAT